MTRQPHAPRDRHAEFESLYERIGARLLVYLTRRMHDPDAAAELWSECWAVAFERWPRCRASGPEEADGWVFAIARHRLADYYRSGSIERRALERLGWSTATLTPIEEDELARIAELDALRPAISGALAELSEMGRSAVQMRVVGGLPYRDVADRLGCSEQAARAHVSRGLRRLAEIFECSDRTTARGRTP